MDDEPQFIEVSVLGEGKSFGELALITNKPRYVPRKANLQSCNNQSQGRLPFCSDEQKRLLEDFDQD
jgi:hypothetical protein